MKDCTAEAENLFREFAARHALAIEKIDEPDVDLLMRVPRQPGLAFELTLALQNADEVNIGFEDFWSYFFPFEEKRALVESMLDGIATGHCRLAIHRQFGRIVKRVLERRTDVSWQPVYAAVTRLQIPWIGTAVSDIDNCGARP